MLYPYFLFRLIFSPFFFSFSFCDNVTKKCNSHTAYPASGLCVALVACSLRFVVMAICCFPPSKVTKAQQGWHHRIKRCSFLFLFFFLQIKFKKKKRSHLVSVYLKMDCRTAWLGVHPRCSPTGQKTTRYTVHERAVFQVTLFSKKKRSYPASGGKV